MKTFFALFTCEENGKNHEAWKKLSPEAQQERMEKGTLKKEQWEQKYKDQIIYDGGPLGNKTKVVDTQGVHDVPSLVGAFIVVKANSHEDAAEIFVDHPHFSYFPGDGVEITECTSRF